jgi:hypothetical protein
MRKARSFKDLRVRTNRVADELREIAWPETAETLSYVRHGIFGGTANLIAESTICGRWSGGGCCKHLPTDFLAQPPHGEFLIPSRSHGAQTSTSRAT